MPAPRGRDLDETREQLTDWFIAKLDGASDVQIGDLVGPGTTGFSNDTLMFDLKWNQQGVDHHEQLVIRISPTGHQIFPDYDMELQFRVQAILAETEVPVARMLWSEPGDAILGAPFYVMERVEGRIPTDNPPYHVGGWVTEITARERESIWWSGLDVMTRVHRLDWKDLGFDFLDSPADPITPLERQLDQYDRYLEWAAGGKPQPICTPALAWLRDNRPRGTEPKGLCWGDARIGNMIFRDGRCVAVLDWEMVTLGNPEQDLAWFVFLDRHHSEGLGAPRLAGFPSREETVARYGEVMGRPVQHLDYYERFAAFRFSVIMIRLAQQMREYGVLPPGSNFEVDNIPSRLLAGMLDLPMPGS